MHNDSKQQQEYIQFHRFINSPVSVLNIFNFHGINNLFWYLDNILLFVQQLNVQIGKTLGGTDIINGFAMVRGNPKLYEKWVEKGADGWSYDEVLPYFLRMEDFTVPKYLFNGE